MPISTQLEGDLDALDRLNADVKANSEQQQLPVARELLVQQALDSIINGTSDSWLGSVMIKPELASSILLDAQKQFENDRAKTGIVSLQTGFNKDSTNAANKDGIISVLRSTGANMVGKYIDYQLFQDLNNAKNPRYFQREGDSVLQNPSIWQLVTAENEGGSPRYTAYVNAYDIGNKGTLVGQYVTVDGSGKILDVQLGVNQRTQGPLKEILTSGMFPILMAPFLGPLAGYIGSAASAAGVTLSAQMATAAAQAFVNAIPQIANGADPSKVIGSIAISLGTPALADKLGLDPTFTKIAGNVLNAAMDPENFVQRLATFTIQDLATSQISQYLQDNNLISSANIANKTAGLVVQTALTQGKNLEAIMTNPSAMMNFVRSNQDLISTALNTATQEQAAQGMTPLERMAFADANAATQGLISPAEFVQKTGMNQAQWRDFYLTNQEAARNASPQEFFDQTGMTQAQYRDFLETNFGPAQVTGQLSEQEDARRAMLVLQTLKGGKAGEKPIDTENLFPISESYTGPNNTTFVRDLRSGKIYQVMQQNQLPVEGGQVSTKTTMLGAVESLPATAIFDSVLYTKNFNDLDPSVKAEDIDLSGLVRSNQVDTNIKPVGNLVVTINPNGTITQRDRITGDTATFDADRNLIGQQKSFSTRVNETFNALTGTAVGSTGELLESWSGALRQAGLSNDEVTQFFTRMKDAGERQRPEFVNKQATDFVNEIYRSGADPNSTPADWGKAIFNAFINNPIGAIAVGGSEIFQEAPAVVLGGMITGGRAVQFLMSSALNVAESAGAAAVQKIEELKAIDRADPLLNGQLRSNEYYKNAAMSDFRNSGTVTALMGLIPGMNNVWGRLARNPIDEGAEEFISAYLNTGDLEAAKGSGLLGAVIGGKVSSTMEGAEKLAGMVQRRLAETGSVPRIYADSNINVPPEGLSRLTFTAKRITDPIVESVFSEAQQQAVDEIVEGLNGVVQAIDPDDGLALVRLNNGDVEVIDASSLALNPGDKITLSDSSLSSRAVSQLTGNNLYVASTYGDKALVVDTSGNKAIVSIKDTDITKGQTIGAINGSGTTDLDAINKAQADLAARTYNGTVYETVAAAEAAKKQDADARAADQTARTYNGTVYESSAAADAARKKDADALAARTYNGKVYDTVDAALAAKNADELAAKNALDAKQAADLAARTYQGTVYDTAQLAQQAKADNQAKTKQDVSQLLTSMGIDPTAQLVDSLSEGDPTAQEVLARMRSRSEELQGLRKVAPTTTFDQGVTSDTSGTPTIINGGVVASVNNDGAVVVKNDGSTEIVNANDANTGQTLETGNNVTVNNGTATIIDATPKTGVVDKTEGTGGVTGDTSIVTGDTSVVTGGTAQDTSSGTTQTKPTTQPLILGKYATFDEFAPGEYLVRLRFDQAGKTPTDQQVKDLLDAAKNSGVDLSNPNAGSTPEYQSWANLVYDTSIGKPTFVPLDVRPNIVPPDTVSTEDTISLQDTVPAQDTIRSTIVGGQETVPGGVKSDVITRDDIIINNIRNDTEETVRPAQQLTQQPAAKPAEQGTPFDYRPLLGLFPFLMGKPSQQQTEYIDYAQPQVPAPELYGIYQLPAPEYTRATGPTAPVGIMSGETK